METPFLKVEIPTTFKDHPGVFSAALYTKIHQCNLNCYQCHNRHYFKGEEEFFTEKELREKLKMLKLLGVELVIVSGGEPTLEDRLEEGLRVIKEENFPVRVDTNGTCPERVEKLIKNRLIDGLAVDVKIPLLDDYTPDQLKRFMRILFSREDLEPSAVYNYSKKLRITIEIIKRYTLPYTIFRTVKYPLLTESEIELIRKELKSFPHQVNPFYPVEE
ncbi:pyruvate formate lyase activating enzyme [Thermovibrio guaymasensis]|uniref:Pyruvate formate lyase activating enzyme n=1 Tax=Thermovibrio guaymasensis TaxID=240167 RepID=A0A420W5I9_9BACT|nr:radical SAM protein [Thermovibrio guaymasensis]RKQ60333.1 pyruvate formate lyase activating enzyme [Thermovibrio guaymasensis]